MNTTCSSCTYNKNKSTGLYNLTDSTDSTIKGIQITGSQLIINYTGGSTPLPPTGTGKCVKGVIGTSDTYCNGICTVGGQPCTPDRCNNGCKFIYNNNPCQEKPCKNNSSCTASSDNTSFTCKCSNCYTGTTCEIIKCADRSECQSGSEGCVPNLKTCECTCDSNCYIADSSTKTCKIKDCGKCDGGVCICQNGKLVCNKNPPLDKYMVGYYCPTCPSASNLSENDLLSTQYNVIPLAFINFDNNGNLNLVSDSSNCWGGVGGQPNNNKNVCPSKDLITKLKNKGKKVIGSIGGGAGGIMDIADINPTYISNFVSDAIKIINENNLDGIDFDIEHRSTSSSSISADLETIGLTMREIARQIKSKGYIVTSAPQCSNIGLCAGNSSSTGSKPGNNALISAFGVPSKSVSSKGITFDKDLLTPNPFWVVFPQMYNAGSAAETPESISNYWKKMTTTGFVQKGTLADYTVKFDTTNFIIGVPSAKSAASSGYNEPGQVINDILKPNPNLRGVMTWDIGADFTNNWNFNNSIGNYLFSS